MHRFEIDKIGPRFEIGPIRLGRYRVWNHTVDIFSGEPIRRKVVEGIFLSGNQAAKKAQHMLDKKPSTTWPRR